MGQPALSGRHPQRRRLAAALGLTAALGALVTDAGEVMDKCRRLHEHATPKTVEWTLVLDYQPNAVHAG